MRVANLATDALDGFFLFGAANFRGHQLEWLDRLRESGAVADPSESNGAVVGKLQKLSRDTKTVAALLVHKNFKPRLLFGHSKGNLVISEALFGLHAADQKAFPALVAPLTVVTLSAKVAMPPQRPSIIDIMGQLDGFGALNSRLDLPTEVVVPLAGHHTHTQLPMHLPVTKTLRALPQVVPVPKGHPTFKPSARPLHP